MDGVGRVPVILFDHFHPQGRLGACIWGMSCGYSAIATRNGDGRNACTGVLAPVTYLLDDHWAREGAFDALLLI